MLSRNLNFRQLVSKELLKVTVVCVDTITVFLILVYHRALPAFSPYLIKDLMWLARMLCMFHLGTCEASRFDSNSNRPFRFYSIRQ